MSKGRLLAKNTLILSIGKFSNQIIVLALLPLYTSFLSPNEYGLLELVITYTTLLSPLLSMQLDTAAFRYLVDARNNEKLKKQIITYTLRMISIVSIVFLVVATPALYIANLRYSLLILFNIVSSIYLALFMQYARGLGKNGIFAISSVGSSLILLIYVNLSILTFKQGLAGIFIAIALSNTAALIYLFFKLRIISYCIKKKDNNIDNAFQKEIMGFAIPLIPNSASWWVIGASDKTIISIYLGLAANGIYTVATKYSAILSSIFVVFGLAITESVALHINKKDSARFISNIFNISLKFFSGLGLVLIAACPYVFELFIGAKFRSAELYVPILVTAAVFSVVVGIYSAVYVAKRATKKIAYANIFIALLNIFLTITLIEKLNIFAAAFATLASYLLVVLFRYDDIKKYVDIQVEKNLLIKVFVSYFLLYFCFYLGGSIVRALALIFSIVIFVLLNSGLVRLLKLYFKYFKQFRFN